MRCCGLEVHLDSLFTRYCGLEVHLDTLFTRCCCLEVHLDSLVTRLCSLEVHVDLLFTRSDGRKGRLARTWIARHLPNTVFYIVVYESTSADILAPNPLLGLGRIAFSAKSAINSDSFAILAERSQPKFAISVISNVISTCGLTLLR